MRRWVWRVLLAALVLAALTVGVFAADSVTIDWDEMEDGNFKYDPIYVNGTTNSRENIKAYRVKQYIGEERKEVAVPDRFHGKPVTEIGVTTTDLTTPSEAQLKAASVFADSKLEGSVSIPNSITAINSGAFSYARMTEVVIPGSVEMIGTYAFAKCSNLVDIQILDYADDNGKIYPSHTTIKAHAFEDCGYIKSLNIPNSVATINDSAFKGCSGLIDLILPYSVKEIKTKAFADCSNLLNVTILASNVEFADDSFEWKDIFAAKDSKPGGYFHCAYSDTVTNIGEKIDTLGLKSSTAKAYKARVHTVTMQSDGLTVTGRTNPLCKASGTNGKATLSFTCNGYNEEVQKVGEDGKPLVDENNQPVMETVHKDCTCYDGKNSYSESRDVSAVYHDERPVSEVVDPTCATAGRKGGTKCAICGDDIEPPETTPATGIHTYLDDGDPDGKTEVEELFPGRCVKGGASLPGQNMVTKKCSVCGYTPVCFMCEELKLALEEANAELETAQEELETATAELEKAKAELEKANAAKTAAGEALTKAEEEAGRAKTAYEAAQKAATEAENELKALGDDASEEAKEAAQKKFDEAKAEEKKALAEYQAAEAAKLRAELEKERADAAATEAAGALTTATNNETAAQGAKTGKETAVWDAQRDLKTHLENQAEQKECAECLKLLDAIRAAKSASVKEKAKAAYEAHKNDTSATTTHKTKAIPAGVVSIKDSGKPPEHQWVTESVEWKGDTKVPDCVTGVPVLAERIETQVCSVCDEEREISTKELREPNGEHVAPEGADVIKEVIPGDCEHGEQTVYEDYTCTICKTLVKGEIKTGKIPGHHWVNAPDVIIKEPTCTDGGLKNTYKVCDNENCPLKGVPQLKESNVPINPDPKGHTWGEFDPEGGPEAMIPNETCVSKDVTGKVKCTVCGVEEEHTLTIEGLGKHTWGEWEDSEDSEDGKQVRECSVCGKTEERDDPNKPVEPDDPDDPDDPDEPEEPDEPGKPTEPEKPKDYQVNIIQGSNGTATANRTTAKSGDQVTVTVSPASGYELDMLRVISADGKVLNLTSLGGGQYRFTMSAANAEVRVTFSKKSSSSWSGSNWASDPGEGSSSTDPRRTTDVMPTQNPTQSVPKAGAYEQLFRDIPTNHWAAGEINWANQMGYMNGTAGRFNPDGNITHQQMWMVLARLTGNHPANMAEARRWAVEHSFADGSSPTGAVARHQLVTALYRCAHLMGSTNRNTTSLAGYPDSRTVPAVARDAYSWALANGIVSGTANGRLDPNGTLTRAQFAVILYRYSQRI